MAQVVGWRAKLSPKRLIAKFTPFPYCICETILPGEIMISRLNVFGWRAVADRLFGMGWAILAVATGFLSLTQAALAFDGRLRDNAVYVFKVIHSGKCLDVSQVSNRTGQPLHQWACLGRQQKNQQFRAIAMGNGFFQLRALHSGKCMDVAGVSTKNGAILHQWDCLGAGQRNQLFRLVPIGELYQLRAAHSGKCVDVAGVSTNDGAPIHQWQCLGLEQANQLFMPRRMR